MAFSSTLVKKEQKAGGDVLELYTWTSSGGTTTGNVTADTTQVPKMVNIETWSVSSNGDTSVVVARDAGTKVAKLTFTANDSGTLAIRGPAA